MSDAEDADPNRVWRTADNLDAVGASEPGWTNGVGVPEASAPTKSDVLAWIHATL